MRKLTSGFVSAQQSESVDGVRPPFCDTEGASCGITMDSAATQAASIRCESGGIARRSDSSCKIDHSSDRCGESKRAAKTAAAIKYTTVTQVHINAPAHC